MHVGIGHKEAVRLAKERLAKERLGEVSAQELAAYIQEAFGLAIRPPIVTVLLGTLLERAALDRSAQEARDRIERWKAENPEEAKRLAASERRKEAARRKKAAGGLVAESAGPAAPAELRADRPVEGACGSSGGGATGDLPGLPLRREGAAHQDWGGPAA
jgi:hypothetical protein